MVPSLSPSGSWFRLGSYAYPDNERFVTVNVRTGVLFEKRLTMEQDPLLVPVLHEPVAPPSHTALTITRPFGASSPSWTVIVTLAVHRVDP